MIGTANIIVLFVVAFVTTGVFACSAAEEVPEIDEISASLRDVPEGTVTRFILVVETGKDGKASAEHIETVARTLHESGAEKVEALENSPIIFVTCEVAAIYKAAETGLLSSVQVDRLSKPQ